MTHVDPRPRATSGVRAATRAPDRAAVVVVAEDEDDLRDAVAELLADAGYDVVAVATVARLRALIATVGRATWVVDHQLADGTTTDVLGELVAHAGAERVLLVSASSAAAHVARSAGVSLLRKPFDLDALVAAVDRASGRADAEPGAA